MASKAKNGSPKFTPTSVPEGDEEKEEEEQQEEQNESSKLLNDFEAPYSVRGGQAGQREIPTDAFEDLPQVMPASAVFHCLLEISRVTCTSNKSWLR